MPESSQGTDPKADAAPCQYADQIRLAIESAPIVLFNQDRQLRYIWVFNEHPAFASVAVLGKRDADLLPEDEAARLTEIKSRVLSTGNASRDEVSITVGGQPRYYDLIVKPLLGENGSIVGVTCASIDITERRLAEQHLSRDLADMTRLQRVGSILVQNGDLELVLTEILETAIEITGADFGNIQMLDPATGDLRIVKQRGFSEWWLDYWRSVSKGRGTCGTALERGERVIVEDIERSPIFAGTDALRIQRRAGIRAVQSTPLICRTGLPVGIVSTHFNSPRRPSERALAFLDLLAQQAAEIIARAQTETTLRKTRALLCETEQMGRVGGWEIDIDTGEQIWTDEVYRIHEVAPDYQPTVEQSVAFYTPESRPSIDRALRASLQFGEPFDMVLALTTAKGNQRWVHVVGKADLTSRRVSGYLQDVTERRNAEESLRRLNETLEQRVAQRTAELNDRTERLRAVFNTAFSGIVTIDRQGIIQEVNQAAERLFGYTQADLVGQNVKLLMPPPYRDEHDSYLDRYQRTGVARIMGTVREVIGRRKDGSIFPLELAISEVDHLGLFTGILRDVSERKELQRHVLEIAAEEQRRIGQELHDGTGQELTGLSLIAGSLLETLDGAATAEIDAHTVRFLEAADFSRLEHVARRLSQGLVEANRHVQDLSHGIMPVQIDGDGLKSALEELAAAINEQEELDCRFEYCGPVEVANNTTATHLYRIAQEAINNGLRHGKASEIRVSLSERDFRIVLEVNDNGVGFDPVAVNLVDRAYAGMGLRIMHYRASLIGGVLTVESGPGRGTLVRCVLERGHGLP